VYRLIPPFLAYWLRWGLANWPQTTIVPIFISHVAGITPTLILGQAFELLSQAGYIGCAKVVWGNILMFCGDNCQTLVCSAQILVVGYDVLFPMHSKSLKIFYMLVQWPFGICLFWKKFLLFAFKIF
jgi:hypothetical protein